MKPETVRKIRLRLGDTLDEFAARLGFKHKSSVWRIETGKQPPSGAAEIILKNLAKNLGIGVA